MSQTTMERASATRRVMAWVIDFLVLFFVAIQLETLLLPQLTEAIAYVLLGVVAMGYFFLKDSVRGRSIGKLLTGVQVIDVESGRPLQIRRSIERNAVVVILIVLAVLITERSRYVVGDEIAVSLGVGLIMGAFAAAYGGAFRHGGQTAGDRLANAMVRRVRASG
jgi:protein-S-isoprenylcysteine O-methyltransferase Ste14